MWHCRQSELIEVRRSAQRGRGGRGVFAVVPIPAGTLIERVPVLLIPREQVFAAAAGGPSPGPQISWYVFDWAGHTKRDYVALALGYGSIYNHADEPNAEWTPEPPDALAFRAARNIAAGDEVFISYKAKDGGAGHELGFEPNG